MTTYLIYPPFADPTQPYGSLPALKGSLAAQGLPATVVDLNVEAAHHLLDPATVYACAEKISSRFSILNARPRLNIDLQLEYLALIRAREAALRYLCADSRPIAAFGDPKRFFDSGRYGQARNLAEDALAAISGAHFPYRFHFNQAAHLTVPWGRDLLERYFHLRQSPLDAFYRAFLASRALQPGDIVGISLTFISQIPEAFYLLQLIRQSAPRAFTVMGGSCLQQILCHVPTDVQRWIVSQAHAVCLREGEAALAGLVQGLSALDPNADEQTRLAALAGVPNLMMRVPGGTAIHTGPMHQTDLKTLAEPDFSDLDLGRYLAPEPALLFAPTRGCYWNRCSFCDYGLNRTGLHGYREMPAAEAARQIAALCRRYGVRHVYLAVDVLSPRYAEALAKALISIEAGICWSTDLRIDSYYTPQLCALLFQSGLRAVAFGVESGSNHMLELMDKGLDTALICRVNADFHRAGIATAWMTFSDHPGETAAMAMETVDLIRGEQSRIDLFILGRFGLTSGSDVFNHPQQYGVRKVFYCRGDDFRLFPLLQAGRDRSAKSNARLEARIESLSRRYRLDHYPWAGAIATHHSLLYFLKFGQRAFRSPGPVDAARPRPGRRTRRRLPEGLTAVPVFDTAALEIGAQRFFEDFWNAALRPGKDNSAPLDLEFFNNATRAASYAKA